MDAERIKDICAGEVKALNVALLEIIDTFLSKSKHPERIQKSIVMTAITTLCGDALAMTCYDKGKENREEAISEGAQLLARGAVSFAILISEEFDQELGEGHDLH